MANDSLSEESLAARQPKHASMLANEHDSRPTQTRIRLRIPKNYHDEPVISRLSSHYGLTVNITAALLGANARDDGWFDLELRGTHEQIRSALLYFNELDLEIWSGDTEEQSDGW
ncbi:MAG: NIL domain-containing protein [Verrucomicrobia bacterium]|nr:NIL domain-containing protein [Leptolyngbya sp. ES-bin-22]